MFINFTVGFVNSIVMWLRVNLNINFRPFIDTSRNFLLWKPFYKRCNKLVNCYYLVTLKRQETSKYNYCRLLLLLTYT